MAEVQLMLKDNLEDSKKFNWSGYNKSQMKEKILFLQFLKELCVLLPKEWKLKRKPIELSHIIFCICMKSYCLKSGRRIIGELELAKKSGYIDKVPHFNTLFKYLRNPNLTYVLQELIKLTSIPLASVEKKLCGDSTGISTLLLNERWSKVRQNYEKHHKYVKLHASFGALTNIITSCRVTESKCSDSIMLKTLVDETCENFSPEEYSWDKAYLSRENLEVIWKKNCLPFIPFKSNSHPRKRNIGIWTEMYNFFKQNNELFMKKYHLRSNAESGFKMLKDRFGDLTHMRSEVSMINDVLCKCLCYNICILCQELFLLNIPINFAPYSQNLAHLHI